MKATSALWPSMATLTTWWPDLRAPPRRRARPRRRRLRAAVEEVQDRPPSLGSRVPGAVASSFTPPVYGPHRGGWQPPQRTRGARWAPLVSMLDPPAGGAGLEVVHAPPGMAGALSSGLSTMTASVVRNSAAIEAAFCSAERVTLAASMTPARTGRRTRRCRRSGRRPRAPCCGHARRRHHPPCRR